MRASTVTRAMKIIALLSIAFLASLPLEALRDAGQQPPSPAQPSAPPPAPPPPAPTPPILKQYKPVTADRLKKPDDGDWLTVRRTYDGWGYSPLQQITTANVGRLQPAWVFSTGVTNGHEAPPMVNNGVMFVATPGNQVIAIEAKTGVLLWRYKRPLPEDVILLHATSRGVALYGDKVYFAAGDAVLVALDAATGKEVWTATVGDNKQGYYMSVAPLVAGGKVIVGASGGEVGVRGFVSAFDAETGKPAWKTFTVPAPGEPGSETWPTGDQWKTGGGSVWVTGNYDPETNLTFWGTGNGGPWMGDQRPGDNLYTSSTVAFDVATGAIKGHFQYHPNDSWDWDEVSPPILVDYQRNGRMVKGLINVARDGYLWFLERSNGPIKFVEGKPYVIQNVFRALDPKTGKPDVDPAHKPGTGRRTEFCPGSHGGKNWPPIAFNPQTRMIYIPANNGLCGALTGIPVTYQAGKSFAGTQFGGPPISAPGADHVGGEVQAWNVDTGQRVWRHKYEFTPNWGSMLTTAGGLVFTGGTNDRKIHAFDATTGKLLWESITDNGIVAPPTTFTVDGKQYVAVLSGWGGDVRGMNGAIGRLFPGKVPEPPDGGAIAVYALP
jgi:alcohol dehydrogenase (cytochrome c)